MSEIFDIEKIVGHRIHNDEVQYLVKWKGYDSTNNTWEPKKNFMSAKIIDEYHDMKNAIEMENDDLRKKRRKFSAPRLAILSGEDIKANKLVPIKVLNIHHQMGDEKSLIALIQFSSDEDDKKETGYVPAGWANEHCSAMVIKFYESRIFWKNKHTGELSKCIYNH